MTTDMQWVLGAGAAIWLGLAAYITFLLVTQRELERRVRRLELLRDE